MKDTVKLPHIHYGQEEAAELERASLKVQHIFDKTQIFLNQYMPLSLWSALTGIERDSEEHELWGSNLESDIFQIWIQSPKGWKCIGFERHSPPSLQDNTLEQDLSVNSAEMNLCHNKGIPGRMLQMVIWSLFEKIRLLKPFLGDDPFFTEEEMDVISNYFVPTYLSPMPLKERGKNFKIIQTRIPLYQEHISAPSLVIQSEDVIVTGNWMTGVDLNSNGFSGLRPYLKVPQGERNYMKALIV